MAHQPRENYGRSIPRNPAVLLYYAWNARTEREEARYEREAAEAARVLALVAHGDLMISLDLLPSETHVVYPMPPREKKEAA